MWLDVALVSALWLFSLVLIGLCARPMTASCTGYGGHSVLALVPAHDEEAAIRATVESLLIAGCQVTVICDRCRDHTDEIASITGAWVYPVECGNKGAALNRYLSESDTWRAYDYIAVVDCGTQVSAGFAGAVRDWLRAYRYVQMPLRSTGGLSAVNVWYSWQYGIQYLGGVARQWLRLPAWIGGTGWAWRSSECVRFDESSVTEDIGLSLVLHAGGASVAYGDCPVYDEKPMSIGVAWRQLVRWSRGAWRELFRLRWFSVRVDDVANAVVPVVQVVGAWFMIVGLVTAPMWVICWLLVYWVIGSAGLVRLGQAERISLRVIPMIWVMGVVSGLASAWGLVTVGCRQWVRTPHRTGCDSDAANAGSCRATGV